MGTVDTALLVIDADTARAVESNQRLATSLELVDHGYTKAQQGISKFLVQQDRQVQQAGSLVRGLSDIIPATNGVSDAFAGLVGGMLAGGVGIGVAHAGLKLLGKAFQELGAEERKAAEDFAKFQEAAVKGASEAIDRITKLHAAIAGLSAAQQMSPRLASAVLDMADAERKLATERDNALSSEIADLEAGVVRKRAYYDVGIQRATAELQARRFSVDLIRQEMAALDGLAAKNAKPEKETKPAGFAGAVPDQEVDYWKRRNSIVAHAVREGLTEREKIEVEFIQHAVQLATEDIEARTRVYEAYSRRITALDEKEAAAGYEALFAAGSRQAALYRKAEADAVEHATAMANIGEVLGQGWADRVISWQEFADAERQASQLREAESWYTHEQTILETIQASEEEKTRLRELYASRRAGILAKETRLEQVTAGFRQNLMGSMTAVLTQDFGVMTNQWSKYERAVRGTAQAHNANLAGMVGALGQAVAAELNAIAARSAVLSIFELAGAFASLAMWNIPSATNHLLAAAEYAGLAGATLAGAAAVNTVRPMSNQEQDQLNQAEQQQAQQGARGTTVSAGGGDTTIDTRASLPEAKSQPVVNVYFSGSALLTKAEVAAELDELMRYLDNWRG